MPETSDKPSLIDQHEILYPNVAYLPEGYTSIKQLLDSGYRSETVSRCLVASGAAAVLASSVLVLAGEDGIKLARRSATAGFISFASSMFAKAAGVNKLDTADRLRTYEENGVKIKVTKSPNVVMTFDT
jgi:hypothetical protein